MLNGPKIGNYFIRLPIWGLTSKEWIQGCQRRDLSLNVANAAQLWMAATRMTPPPPPGGSGDKGMPQENTRFKETQKYLRENCYHCIKCITTTFLAAFMWRGPLNSVTLTTTTHKRSERVFDGMGTQVAVQMIDKCKIKMIQRGIHKMRDALPQRRGKRKKREDGST